MSDNIELGILKEIKDVREVWKNEATNFTPWLYKDGIELLAETLLIDIETEEKESSVGDFSLDILAKESGTGKRIIIENQLEDTDHDHLGKLITYASGKDAKIIIWIVKKARDEHKSAIEWLNNNTNEEIGFFLLEIKLFQIENSKYAPKFEIIEKPNEWSKSQKLNQNKTKAQDFRLNYWEEFNNYSDLNNKFRKLFNKRKPSKDAWMSFAMGSSQYHLNIWLITKNNQIGIEFLIENNKDIFNKLFKEKQNIQNDLGFELEWNELPEKKSSNLKIFNNADFNNQSQWHSQMDWAMEKLIQMKNVLIKYL